MIDEALFTPSTATWSGTCAFRLLPDHELSPAPATASTRGVAEGVAWTLDYVWVHPEDGVQEGHLVVGGPREDGTVTAGWVDSWHQKDEIALLAGTSACPGDRTGEHSEAATGAGAVQVAMGHSGWGWRIEVFRSDDALRLRMYNVVPKGVEGVEGVDAGPYLVMDAAWEPVRA